MNQKAKLICHLAQETATAVDTDTALQALTELRRELDAFELVQVRRALAGGHSFSDVARALGTSRQAAHRRFRELAPDRRDPGSFPLVATTDVRRAIRVARAEASAAGLLPGSGHVVLGILRTESDAARALRSEGVTLQQARRGLHSGAEVAAITDSSCLRRILSQAARVARARGDSELAVEPLLLAALADVDGGARGALTALGVDPESVGKRLGSSGQSSSAVVAA